MIQAIKQKFQGSVLVFTLLALSVLLLGALSLATATLVGQKTAKDTDHSMQAFQTSDSGAELVLKKLKDASSGDALSTVGCSSNAVTGTVRSGDSYTVEFFDDDTDTQLDCSASIGDVDRIKSTGRYAGTARAIETVVASDPEYDISSLTIFSGDPGWTVGHPCRTNPPTSGDEYCDCWGEPATNPNEYVCIAVGRESSLPGCGPDTLNPQVQFEVDIPCSQTEDFSEDRYVSCGLLR